jgi:phosphoribosylformylglycinamidine (FGAM) synthase-like amidotransferase family enzyme
VKHGEGLYVADDDAVRRLEDEGGVVFRYCSPDGELGDGWNPNGSIGHIAGVRSDGGNVVGLMPHPEHAVDPDLGPTGGRALFESLLASLLARV